MPQKIGVFGGTFDPIHLGHLAIAEEALKSASLSEVIFVPAGHPYFKALSRISSPKHRVNMLKLALCDRPEFKISLMEIERAGPSYAVDTIIKVKQQNSAKSEIYFIMGWDSLATLPKWEKPEKLISFCFIIASPRPGFPKPDLVVLEKELPGISQRARIMNQPLVDISATNIRERVRQGLSIDGLVPALVARYIRDNMLYLD